MGMKTKLVKRLALLAALLMLAVCLPVSGMAENDNKSTMNVMVGSENWIYLEDEAWDDLESYFSGFSFEELNQILTFSLEKVGKGITISEKRLAYEPWEEEGQTYYYIPCIAFSVNGAEAHGESIVFSIYVKPENKTYRYEVKLAVVAAVKEPVVSATAATKVEKTKDGFYSITAEEGSFVTITPVYEDMNGKKLAMDIEWTTYDYEDGQSNILSKQNTHTFEITKALDGDDLEWSVYLPSVDHNDYRWIHLTVVPKGTLILSSAPTAPSVPSTGDNSSPMLWLAGMLMASAGCAVLLMKRRQNG